MAISTSLDPAALRARFPGLHREVGGRPCVFADAPGGTQVPASVIDAMTSYLSRSNANTGGAFATSAETDAMIAEARGAAADLLGCGADEVAFGQNMTTLAFALSRAMGRDLGPGDDIVLTVLDHDANISPWLAVAERTGAAVRWVDVREDDLTLDLDSLDEALSGRPRVVAFTLASNAVGTVTPAAEIARRAREAGAVTVADAVHATPHRHIDAVALGVDVLLCSAYKFFGPHVGVLAGRRDLLEAWRPFRVRPASDDVPDRWETGTLNHEGLAGLSAAVDYLAGLAPGAGGRAAAIAAAMAAVEKHEAALSARFLTGAQGLPGLRLFGLGDPDRIAERTPTFAFRVGGRSPREVAEALAARGVFVWNGNYYALAIMERLGLEETGGAVRAGFCHYHSLDDVDRVLEELAALGP